MAQNPFSEEEQEIIFVVARIALSDADTFEDIACQMNLNDDTMIKVRDHLGEYQMKPKFKVNQRVTFKSFVLKRGIIKNIEIENNICIYEIDDENGGKYFVKEEHICKYQRGENSMSNSKKPYGEINKNRVRYLKYVCENCSSAWTENDLDAIEDVEKRVLPGEIMPAGQCPECGAVCHGVKT